MSTRTAHRHLERHTLPCPCGVEREPEHSVGNRIDKTLAEDRPVRHRARGADWRCRPVSGRLHQEAFFIARPSVCWSCERVLDRTRKEQLQQCTRVQFLCREWITILYISRRLNVRSGEPDVRSIGGRVVGRAPTAADGRYEPYKVSLRYGRQDDRTARRARANHSSRRPRPAALLASGLGGNRESRCRVNGAQLRPGRGFSITRTCTSPRAV